MRTRWAFASAVVIATIAVAGMTAVPAVAGPAACDSRTNDTVKKLLQCVTLAGVREHQAALQAIADANGGNRFAGLPGHDESVAYVVDKLEAAGYDPEIQPFDYLAFGIFGPSTLEQTTPVPTVYVEGTDYQPMDQTDPGDVTAAVTAVDVHLALPRASDSGCDGAFATDPDTGETVPDPGGPDDFAGFTPGNIALMQRGTCTFELKAANASAAGAVGVILFNQGNTPEREGLINGTLGATNASGIPVIDTTFARGEEWAGTAGLVMHIFTNTVRRIETTFNVIAELQGRHDHNVVMVGGHLDSVSAGPGINDNGSGSAALLEIAEQMKKVKPMNTVRFAWWAAEESGLVGSDFYVANLSADELDDIALYLNFDMVGSPNYVRFVYDGDGTIGPVGPEGSGAIEDLFVDFYGDRGLASDPTPFDGRSDYGPFILAGVPAGGLFTGAEGIKTPAQAVTYGGTAGSPYDACYHKACDTFDNVNLQVLDLNSDAIAFATLTYAMDTSSVTGP